MPSTLKMNMSTKLLIKLLASTILFWLIQIQVFGQEKNDAKTQLNEVISQFQNAISNKDSVAFNKLFFAEKIPFTGIMSKKTEASIKKNYPDFEGISVSDNQKFIRGIGKSTKKEEEKFYHIKIDTDGKIANISFDYSFHSDSKMIQWGNEKWNLVFAENKWLITDVIYSIHFPKVEVFPFSE